MRLSASTRLLGVLAVASCSIAQADIVRVVITGSVEQNSFRTGTFAGVRANDPVTLSFDLNSTVFLDSPNQPGTTRGYSFVPGTFHFQAGSVSAPLLGNPPAYFVLQNNNPRADAFFISQGTDSPTTIPLDMTPANYGVEFSRTFNINTPFPEPDNTLTSLDILDALGSWGFDNISSYNFNIARGEFSTPMVIGYETITLSNVSPSCPADFNNDGGVDGGDVEAFYSAWEAGDTSADVNGDGGVDGGDVETFFSAWEAGGCN